MSRLKNNDIIGAYGRYVHKINEDNLVGQTGPIGPTGQRGPTGPSGSATNIITDTIDVSKQIEFNISGAITGKKTTLNFNQTTNNIITVPNISDTLAVINANQTLKNKIINEHDGNIFTDRRLQTAQHIRVKIFDAGVGEFSSIKAAVESITDATASKPYFIEIGPGVFIEDTINMIPNVYLEGSGTTTTIRGRNAWDIIINGTDSSGIAYCKLETLLPTSSQISINLLYGQFTGHQLTFGDCYTGIYVNSVYASAFMSLDGITVASDAVCDTFVLATDNGINNTAFLISNASYFSVSGGLNNFIVAHGKNTTLFGTACGFIKELMVPAGKGISIYDGTYFTGSSFAIIGFDTAFEIQNVGVGASMSLFSSAARVCTHDLMISHPDSFGAINGIYKLSNSVFNPLAKNLGFLITDTDSGELTNSAKINILNADRIVTDITSLIVETPAMGLLQGGELTDGGGFTVNVTSGTGYISTDTPGKLSVRKIIWNNTFIILTPNTVNYLYFNSNNILAVGGIIPKTIENVYLGKVVTNNYSIQFIDNSALQIHHLPNLLDAFNRFAFGPIYVSGSTVTADAARELSITQGIFYLSENRFAPSGAQSPAPIQTYYRNGLGGWNITPVTIVDNANYDDSSGTLHALTVGYYTKHSLYVVCDGRNEKYFMVYGQNQYTTLLIAETAPVSTPPICFKDAIVLIATLIVQQGSPTIQEIRDERPMPSFKASAVSGSAVHGNLLGLGEDNHLQYVRTDGTRIFSGNVNLGYNNIINVNYIDGVSINLHGARHLPNGQDALMTDMPLTISGTSGSNLIGLQNSFSRSDHVHTIDQSTLSLNSIGGTLSVSKGGLGVNTLVAGNFILGNGLNPVTDLKIAPVGTVVGTSDIQTLTNKNITDATNIIATNSLKTRTLSVDVSGSNAPITNDILVATSATSAVWKSSYNPIFGTGCDGNVIISTNFTPIRDMYYNNLTVDHAITFNTGGFRIYVKGKLTLNGHINNDGVDANGAIRGNGAPENNVGGGANGGNGSIANGTPGANTSLRRIGGIGGGGGVTATHLTSQAGGSGTLNPANNGDVYVLNSISYGLTGQGFLGNILRGGGGGSGGNGAGPGNLGGGGGGGGGICIVFANYITGVGTISANGGRGGDGNGINTGGGGGGGGGALVVGYSNSDILPSNFTANGGYCGIGGGSGANGLNGLAGQLCIFG